jgi:pimeloyl-ACP methyl ester carboxylesterase
MPHGSSWQPSTFGFHILTSMNSYVIDAMAVLNFIMAKHSDTEPILVGHSMEGAILQRILGAWNTLGVPNTRPAGVVLLAAAPLSGGGMWHGDGKQQRRRFHESTHPNLKHGLHGSAPSSTSSPIPASILQHKSGTSYFRPEATEDAVNGWLRDSKGRLESIRVSIEHMWPFADATDVVDAIHSDARPFGRKILSVSGGKYVLISRDLTQATFDAYCLASKSEEEVMRSTLFDSAHHIMLDVSHERCAELIIKWIEGKNIVSN